MSDAKTGPLGLLVGPQIGKAEPLPKELKAEDLNLDAWRDGMRKRAAELVGAIEAYDAERATGLIVGWAADVLAGAALFGDGSTVFLMERFRADVEERMARMQSPAARAALADLLKKKVSG